MRNLTQHSLFGSKNPPVILQSEKNECGAACLTMVLGYYGYSVSLSSLREQLPNGDRGASFNELVSNARSQNLNCRAISIELTDLDRIALPAILHWGFNHFVVLVATEKRTAIIHDPAIGSRRVSKEELSKKFTGVALELHPNRYFKKKKSDNRVKIGDLWNKVSGLKTALMSGIYISVIVQTLSLAFPFYTQIIIDRVIVGGDQNLLNLLLFAFLGLAYFHLIGSCLRSKQEVFLGSNFVFQIKTNILRHLLHLPLPYFEKRSTGDILSKVSALRSLQHILSGKILGAFIDGVLSIAILVILYFYNAQLASILTVVASVFVVSFIVFSHYQKEMERSSVVASSRENSDLVEVVQGIQSIKLNCSEYETIQKWQQQYTEVQNASIRSETSKSVFGHFSEFIFNVGRIILIYWSAKLALNNEITTGMLFAFLLYSNIFTNKIRQLLNSFQYAKVLQIQLNRIEDIVTHRPESLPEDELCTKEISIDGNLELKDVSFRYSRTAEHLFKNINLRIKRGEYVCIVGRTGCGKTSLMKLLLGLYSPSSGLILYDGLPLNAVGHKNLRNQIAAVMQDDELSTGSIYQNICDGSLPYDQEWAKECARMALIDKEINKMTMNYYTNVGERGRSLSAGQRQRVLLAKAIYKRPKIIFMDEATAFLDESIERKINDNLRAMNITRVAIAHRADTIRSADRILMLSKDGLSSLDIKGLGKKEGPIIKQRQKDASVESAVQQ